MSLLAESKSSGSTLPKTTPKVRAFCVSVNRMYHPSKNGPSSGKRCGLYKFAWQQTTIVLKKTMQESTKPSMMVASQPQYPTMQTGRGCVCMCGSNCNELMGLDNVTTPASREGPAILVTWTLPVRSDTHLKLRFHIHLLKDKIPYTMYALCECNKNWKRM